jgi:hypothetical protein
MLIGSFSRKLHYNAVFGVGKKEERATQMRGEKTSKHGAREFRSENVIYPPKKFPGEGAASSAPTVGFFR